MPTQCVPPVYKRCITYMPNLSTSCPHNVYTLARRCTNNANVCSLLTHSMQRACQTCAARPQQPHWLCCLHTSLNTWYLVHIVHNFGIACWKHVVVCESLHCELCALHKQTMFVDLACEQPLQHVLSIATFIVFSTLHQRKTHARNVLTMHHCTQLLASCKCATH